MSRGIQRARLDDNQPEIVRALQAVGASVQSLASIGMGCPDLAVARDGSQAVLMEIKDGSKPRSECKLTPAEARWHKLWRGKVYVVHNSDEAIAALLDGLK